MRLYFKPIITCITLYTIGDIKSRKLLAPIGLIKQLSISSKLNNKDMQY